MKERVKTSPTTQKKTRTPTTELPETINSESAIAAKPTQQDVGFAQTSKRLSKEELKSKVNSMARTLRKEGLEFSETLIKEKIFELYPNSDDWLCGDARLDVMRAVRKAVQ